MNSKAALFGGTLLAAGMTANAQSFILLDSGLGGAYPSFAYSNAYGSGGGTFAYAPDPLNTFSSAYSAYTGTTTISTSQSTSELRVEGSWDGTGLNGYGYGAGNIQQFFMVDQDTQLLIEWDVADTDAYARNILIETAAGVTLFAFNGLAGDPLVGSAIIDVDAGVEYAAILGLTNGQFGPFIFAANDTQFVSVSVVPTPGVAGLFGVAGLAATRRRR